MKFKFLIGDPAIAYCTEWSEIEKKAAETERVAPDYETFMLFKALENNVQFEKKVKLARKNLGFPEDGVSWGFYQKYLSRKPDYTKEEFELVSRYLLKSLDESARIIMQMDLHPMISNRLRLIIFAGCITPLYRGIGFYAHTAFEDEDEDEIKSLDDIPYGFVENVNIQISKVTSKNVLVGLFSDEFSYCSVYNTAIYHYEMKDSFYISGRPLDQGETVKSQANL